MSAVSHYPVTVCLVNGEIRQHRLDEIAPPTVHHLEQLPLLLESGKAQSGSGQCELESR
jgi:hypothetical protein